MSPGPDENNDDDALPSRGSVVYQSRELQSKRLSAEGRRSAKSAVFDKTSIGTCTKHGIAPVPGGRGAKGKINQDRGVVCWPFNGSTSEALFCIFDGHGRKGELISEFCMQTIPGLLEENPAALKTDTAAYLSQSVIAMDLKLQKSDLARTAAVAGTTSTVCYLKGNSCWVACSGDSRAVLGQRVKGGLGHKDLSHDHKADLPEEKARILAAGGEVTASGKNGNPPPARVWAAQGGTGLAMSRSLGDLEMRSAGVIPDPDVLKVELAPAVGTADGDLFLIVASDGVWEFIESEEAVSIVSKHSDATEACKTLVYEAMERWREIEGTYRDDITCVIAMLPFLDDVDETSVVGNAPEKEEDGLVNLNKGSAGAAKVHVKQNKPEASEAVTAATHDDFVARRLSVAHFDVDEDAGEEDEED